jgi:hypothetical protein
LPLTSNSSIAWRGLRCCKSKIAGTALLTARVGCQAAPNSARTRTRLMKPDLASLLDQGHRLDNGTVCPNESSVGLEFLPPCSSCTALQVDVRRAHTRCTHAAHSLHGQRAPVSKLCMLSSRATLQEVLNQLDSRGRVSGDACRSYPSRREYGDRAVTQLILHLISPDNSSSTFVDVSTFPGLRP